MTTAREIMHTGATCVGEHETLTTAAQHMRELGVGALPICGDDDRLHGMITDRDIVIKCIAAGLTPPPQPPVSWPKAAPITSMPGRASKRCSLSWKNTKSAACPSSTNTASSGWSAKPTSPATYPNTPSSSSSKRSAPPWPSPASEPSA